MFHTVFGSFEMPNTIMLKKCGGYQDEGVAAAEFYPGHLLEYTSAGKYQKNSQMGLPCELIVALENALVGGTITDAYAADETALLRFVGRGERFQGRVAAAATALAVADRVVSNGAGGFRKANGLNRNLFAAAAAATALNTHTAETAFDVSYTLPKNSLRAGDILHIRAVVNFANASNSTETALIRLKIGSTTIAATVALDHAAGDVAVINATLHVRAVGAAGSILAFGHKSAGVPTTVAAPQTQGFYLAPTAIDTTVAQAITVTQQNSGSNANTGGQLTDLVVDIEREEKALAVVTEALDNSAGVAEAFAMLRAL